MNPHGYIGRKMRLPRLQEKPAIIITAFGSSRQGKAAFGRIEEQVRQQFGEYEIFWAYTSEIIRKKHGLPSLQETLAVVEAAGYRKAVVQPLHVFPGTEYQQVCETCHYFPGLRVVVGETLCHRWDHVHELLDVFSDDFLPADQGLNLLALHGTPLAADPVNIVYMGIEHLVTDLYPNVMAAAIEGVPDHRAIFNRIQQQELIQRYSQVRIIPVMFLAGIHVEDDLMGDEAESWRERLEAMGFGVECPTIEYEGKNYFQGLGFRPQCSSMFVDRLQRAIDLMVHY